MYRYGLFSAILSHLRFLLFSLLGFALVMSGVRLYLYLSHHAGPVVTSELFEAFWIGARLDLSILAYVAALPTLVYLVAWISKRESWVKGSTLFLRLYLFFMFALLSLLLVTDLGFYSYFSEHITIMIFGIIDDDTKALFEIARKNYNLPLIAAMTLLWLWLLKRFAFRSIRPVTSTAVPLFQGLFFVFAVTAVFLVGRGSLGLFPLAKDIPDISSDPLINALPQNGAYAAIDAYKQYTRSKQGRYDLIKTMGYKGRIKEAFALHVNHDVHEPLLENLVKTTPQNPQLEAHPPHVVVVMVESFGAPILKHQSPQFDIMGRLKRHFGEDTLFTRFISAANGTIVSLEPLLLGIAARPESTSFGQSNYLGTPFVQAVARTYQNAGYETHFVYGGDLSWRNVGSFMSRQGFEHQEGKGAISAALNLSGANIAHDWGLFDQYAYDFVLKTLKEATKPQFIFLLTTNNHPPYTIPSDYHGPSLEIDANLKAQITGDFELAQKRLHDYQYALDMAGRFMDGVKDSPLAQNTVVAITADNNTIEGIMHYDDFYTDSKRIPFYLYLPPALHVNTIDTTIPGSHKDIFPTLYNLTLSSRSYISTGTDLRDPNVLHCGFNEAGIIMSKDGGFKSGAPATEAQKRCDAYYRATLSVGEYLITHQSEAPRVEQQAIIRP